MFESSPGAVLKSVTLLQLIVADVWDSAALSLAQADLTSSDQVAFKALCEAVRAAALLHAARTEHPAFTGRSVRQMQLDCVCAHNLLATGHVQLRQVIETGDSATGGPFYREKPPTDQWAAQLPQATWSLLRPETLAIRALLGAELRVLAYLVFAQLTTGSAYDVWNIEDAMNRMAPEFGLHAANEINSFESVRQQSTVESNILVCRNRLFELALGSIDLLRCVTRRMCPATLPSPALDARALHASMQELVRTRAFNGIPFEPAVDVEAEQAQHRAADEDAEMATQDQVQGTQAAPEAQVTQTTKSGSAPRAGASNAGPVQLPDSVQVPDPAEPALHSPVRPSLPAQKPATTPDGGIAGQISGAILGQSTHGGHSMGQHVSQLSSDTSRSSSDLGVRYLADQLKLPDSAYRMPGINASQLVWDQWFQKLHAFCKLYVTPEHMVLHCLTGHLPADNAVMEGWEDASAQLTSQGTPVQIQHFASHVRSKLFSVRCTRADAFVKLTALLGGAEKLPDCKDLARQLAQYYSWVFPEEPRGEHAPTTKFKVCIAVQQALARLRTMNSKSKVVQAWLNVTFDQSAVYDQYLRQSLHFVPAESDALCDSYITFVLQRLRLADEMHAAVHLAPGAAPSASVHQYAPDEHTLQYTGDTKHKRKRGAEPRKPPKTARTPEAQPGPANPQPSSQKGAKRPWLMKEAAVHKEWNTPSEYNLTALCTAARVNQGVSLSALLQRGIHGHCLYCNSQGLHGKYRVCPALKGGDQSAVKAIQDRRRVFREKVQEHGLECALREERAPPPRELPAELARHFR